MKNKIKIVIPTVFSRNKAEFDERFMKLVGISKYIQVDFMDGNFVKMKSVRLTDINKLNRYNNNFEAHLMVSDPEKYLKMLKDKGFKRAIVHYESVEDENKLKELIKYSHKLGMKFVIALNPETAVKKISNILAIVDGILLMGVHPGKEHQKLLPKTFKKIREVRRLDKILPIQIDGGVNLSNIRILAKTGAKIFNSGSFVAESANPKEALKQLVEEANS